MGLLNPAKEGMPEAPGLLDQLFATPSSQAMWALGSGLLGVRRGNEGRALMGAVDAYNQAQQEQRRNQLARIQTEMAVMQLSQGRKQQEQTDLDRTLIRDFATPRFQPGATTMRPETMAGGPLPFDPLAMLQAGASPQAVKMAASFHEKPEPMKLGKDDRLIKPDGRGGYREVVGAAPGDQFEIVGVGPNGQLMQRNTRTNQLSAVGGGPQVVVNTPFEREFDKQFAKLSADEYGKLQSTAMSAQGNLARLDRFAQLLDGVQTGKLTPLGTEVAGFLSAAGIKVDPKLGNKEAARALANEMALQARNPSGGAGMPGAMSDSDRQFLQQVVPSLANTPQGNSLLIETNKRLAKRDMEIAQLARQYRVKNKGRFDEGIYEVLRQYAESNPLFSDLQRQTLPQGNSSQAVDEALRRYLPGAR